MTSVTTSSLGRILRQRSAARLERLAPEEIAKRRATTRKRMRGTIIMFAISLAYLIVFPIAAWSADDAQVDSLIQLA
ncbi:MAG: hypothetical protein JWM25_1166, partial [Thermoleophilia bacterium]|nr:hypothetical protein [Thermoleophilia bacterium]